MTQGPHPGQKDLSRLVLSPELDPKYNVARFWELKPSKIYMLVVESLICL
jgi:hypothetical protein